MNISIHGDTSLLDSVQLTGEADHFVRIQLLGVSRDLEVRGLEPADPEEPSRRLALTLEVEAQPGVHTTLRGWVVFVPETVPELKLLRCATAYRCVGAQRPGELTLMLHASA